MTQRHGFRVRRKNSADHDMITATFHSLGRSLLTGHPQGQFPCPNIGHPCRWPAARSLRCGPYRFKSEIERCALARSRFLVISGRRRRLARMLTMADRNRIAGGERFFQRLIELAIVIALGFRFAAHRLNICKGHPNNKKARYTEVPTPPCSKLACPSLVTARMTNSSGPL